MMQLVALKERCAVRTNTMAALMLGVLFLALGLGGCAIGYPPALAELEDTAS